MYSKTFQIANVSKHQIILFFVKSFVMGYSRMSVSIYCIKNCVLYGY